MKTYPPYFAGWPVSTNNDPHELLQIIWKHAKNDSTGFQGFSGTDENILIFSGIQILIKDKEPMSKDPGGEIKLLIIDGKRVRPEFFDLWEFLKANNLVRGGPDADDKKNFSLKKVENFEELDKWIDIYQAKPTKKKETFEEWALKVSLPLWINYKKIQRRRQEREKIYGEVFQRPTKKKKKQTE